MKENPEAAWHNRPTEYGWWWSHKNQEWEKGPYDWVIYDLHGPWFGPWSPPTWTEESDLNNP